MSVRWALALTLTLAAVLAAPAAAADRFDLAITVDDLPNHGQLPPGMTRLAIARAHIEAFRAHGVPEAFGFVNAVGLEREPGTGAVLDAWRKAGFPLGNHAFSHMNLARASLEAWEADVVAGEPAVAARMAGNDWRWFRYPNLADGGDDVARREGGRAFLKARGYRIADVSLSFSDWAYTDAYARCLAKGDEAAVAAMKAQYLQGVDAELARMKAVSRRVYGRIVPQVLLTHAGGFSAVMLPQTLKRLETAGARYVPLAKAQSDPAYRDAAGGTAMERAAKAKGIDLSDLPAFTPAVDPQTLCR